MGSNSWVAILFLIWRVKQRMVQHKQHISKAKSVMTDPKGNDVKDERLKR